MGTTPWLQKYFRNIHSWIDRKVLQHIWLKLRRLHAKLAKKNKNSADISLQRAQKKLPPAIPADLADITVLATVFPSHDELGRLICKGCGLPYKSWTVNGWLEKLSQDIKQLSKEEQGSISPDADSFSFFNCLNCRKLSVFTHDDLRRYVYKPVGRNVSPGQPFRRQELIRSKTGHLKCQSCGESIVGFTVKGSLALLDQAEEKLLWIACEKCRATSTYSTRELRRALPEEPPSLLQLGETLLNHRIVGVMHGGMSVVYVCLSDSNLIAAKTLRPELSRLPEAEARFRREAETWILLGSHPNIVEARVLTWDKGRSVLLIEFQAGGSLDAWMENGPLSLEAIVRFGIDFCRGMEHARSIIPGFIHRDIKPQNCLIGSDGMLKVSDFGLVKVIEELPLSVTDFTVMPNSQIKHGGFHTNLGRSGMGTLPYMSPEQFQDFSSVDIRSDIYSFGIMLFQMITGHLPITPKTTNDVQGWYDAHSSDSRPDVCNYRDPLPHELSRIVQTCISRSPSDRPENFGVVLEALYSIQRGSVQSDTLRTVMSEQISESREQQDEGAGIEQLDMLRVFNLINIGHHQKALEYAEEIIRIASDSLHERAKEIQARGHALHAMALRSLGNFTEAKVEADKSISLNSEDALGLYERGWLANHEGDYQTAIRCLEKSYNIDPHRPQLPFELGFAYNAGGMYDKAIQILVTAIGNQPDEYIFHREVGFSYLHTAKFKLATKHYERAFALCDPELATERAEIAANLAQVYINIGNKEAGVEWLKMAFWVAPKGSEIHKQLSQFIGKDDDQPESR